MRVQDELRMVWVSVCGTVVWSLTILSVQSNAVHPALFGSVSSTELSLLARSSF